MRDVNSLNRVILVGHLREKPEVSYLPRTQRAVAHFDIATNELIYDPTKNQTSRRAEWHRIVVWGKLAEFCGKYLTKGKQVLIEGRLRSRTWTTREGDKRKLTEIEARSVILLGRREEAEVTESEPFAAEASPVDFPDIPDTAETEFPADTEPDDEVPF